MINGSNNDVSSVLDVYIDGSYSDDKKLAGYAIVCVADDNVIYTEAGTTNKYIDTRNVVGELTAAAKALLYAIKNEYKNINIHYDYAGIEKWITGEWKTKQVCTLNYKTYVHNLIDTHGLKVNFIKVKSHSGVKYNDMADTLAKEALL